MNLDKYQQEVVTSNENILVIAGPGSGKTTTIKEKVNYLLENNDPEDILLLSFTNKSVEDIKKKLNSDVFVMTFHKLAIDILKHYKYKYKIIDTTLLPFIIDEYIKIMPKEEKNKLCRYLNIIKLNFYSQEYISFKKLIITFINLFKTNNNDIKKLEKLVTDYKDKYLIKIILDILFIYEEEKNSTNTLDFDDLIIIATKLLKEKYLYKKFKYIIVDEFQDTSLIRLNLIREIYLNSNSIITAVGDDAQSIFHFSGCDLNIFLSFNKYFPNTKLIYLKNTYRNSQELIDISSKFVEKNSIQLIKNMHSNMHIQKPIELIYYLNPIKALKKVLNLLKDEDDIMILGRNNNDINNYIDNEFTLNGNLLIYNNKEYRYLTIHSSKGLESKYVIILNNSDSMYGLPNKIENHQILNYIDNNINEIPFAEERRVFFVGITRCKIKTYLLVPRKNPSCFINEIKKML